MVQLELDPANQAKQLRQAVAHLETCDGRFLTMFERFGAPKFTVSKNFFFHLVKSIVYQQLAGSAAQKIFGRFLDLFKVAAATQALASDCAVFFQEDDHPYLTPAKVLELEIAAMREVGLSTRKAEYVQDLARAVISGQLDVVNIRMMSDDKVVEQITSIRGLGPWTADMFKMYGLGRLDVLPTGDLGVKKGLAKFFNLSKIPSPEEMQRLAAPWSPYRSVGAYYMWKVLENKAAAAPAPSPQAVLSIAVTSTEASPAAAKSAAQLTPAKRKPGPTKKPAAAGGDDAGAPMPLRLRQRKVTVVAQVKLETCVSLVEPAVGTAAIGAAESSAAGGSRGGLAKSPRRGRK